MARIIFMIDIEEGHLLPSFALARSLKAAGHEVLYISILDNEDFVKNAGFGFHPLFERRYPKGFRDAYKQKKKEKGLHQSVSVVDHIEDFMHPSFTESLQRMKPDLLVMSSFLYVEALMLYYRNKIRPVLLRPFLREPGATITSDSIRHLMNLPAETAMKLFDLAVSFGYKFTSLADLVKPLESFYELVICPKELEMEPDVKNSRTYYIGSGIDLSRYAGPISFLQQSDRRIIYASLGSQAIAYRHLFEMFFEKITSIMSRPDMQDLHLVIAIGAENDVEKYSSPLDNVTIVKWISQMDVLKLASLAIVHGGLGTVKECIYHAVPMIIMPVTHDQPTNGKRIAHHNLGLTLDIEKVSLDEVVKAIRQLLGSNDIKDNLHAMQSRFRKADEENIGLAIIEKLLPQENIAV
ncbi:MAG: glycosyltransferase [Chitinophagaceae bacterium]